MDKNGEYKNENWAKFWAQIEVRRVAPKHTTTILSKKIEETVLNPLMSSVYLKFIHTWEQMRASGLFKYVWLFSRHQSLKG